MSSTQRWTPRLALLQTIFFTVVGVAQPWVVGIDGGLVGASAAVTFGVLLVVGVAGLLTVRLLLRGLYT